MTDPQNTDATRKLYELIDNSEYAMLVTKTPDGSLRSRPMVIRTRPGDSSLWFLTDKDSAKIVEIGDSKQVNVSLADPEARSFVSVTGMASIENDRGIVEELWDSNAQIWYPHGKEDERLTLLKVAPTFAEYWDAPKGVYVELYELAQSLLGSERPTTDRVDHKKLDL